MLTTLRRKNRSLAAEPRELAVLQHLQDFGLQRKAHVADLVEEHRAVVGELELAGLVLDRAGERAALETEQFGLEQLGGERGAVHLHERLVAPERGGIQRPRDKLFPGPALSADEHRHVGVGHALDQVLHFGHALGLAEEHHVFRLRLELLAQRRHLATELVLPERVGQRHLEIGLVERLVDEIGGAQLHRLDHRRRAALAREDDHRDVAIDFLERRERREAVHLARHHDVEDHRGGALGMVALDRFFGAAQRDGVIAALREKRSQEIAHGEVVVDDHDLRFAVEIHARHAALSSNESARGENLSSD